LSGEIIYRREEEEEQRKEKKTQLCRFKRKAPSIVFMEEEAFSSLFSRTHAHRVCVCGGKNDCNSKEYFGGFRKREID